MEDETLERLARRARTRREFLAWAFDFYEQREGPAAGELAAHLGVSRRDLLRLGLYLRPRPDHLKADVRQTAADFGIEPHLLFAVIRFVDAAEAMSGASVTTQTSSPGAPASSAGAPGFLAAARAREPGQAAEGGGQ